MEDKEFDQLTPEEKKARFQKAVDDYNSGFVEVDYTFRSVASIRVEEAMEDAGRVSEEFKPAQIKVIYEAAEADLNVEKPLTRDQIKRIKERMLRAEPKESVLADLNEKKKETARVPKKQGPAKEKGER